jgi:hypothetical protein
MSTRIIEPEYTLFQTFVISTVIYDEGDGVTLCGYATIEGEPTYINLFCDFEQLNAILSVPNKEATVALESIAEKLSTGWMEEPTVLDIVEVAGDYVHMDMFHFIVYKPEISIEEGFEGEDESELSDEDKEEISSVPCYMLESLIPDTDYPNIKDLPLLLDAIGEDLDELYASYQLYLLLVADEFTPQQARKMLHLENEILFGMLEKIYKRYHSGLN